MHRRYLTMMVSPGAVLHLLLIWFPKSMQQTCKNEDMVIHIADSTPCNYAMCYWGSTRSESIIIL
uniref:Uncharacterized protein n=1 Tax=Arundo donax TaxID=35708 RepID=A0A0A9HFM8_ARUDO